MRRAVSTAVILSLLLAGAAFWLAEKEWGGADYRPAHHDSAGLRRAVDFPPGTLSLQEILERLELSPDTRILEVEREHHDGSLYYEIELVTPEGRIFELMIDPHTGKVVGREEED
ncbi:PepSY domain-containing protein [Thiolapillus sp.]